MNEMPNSHGLLSRHPHAVIIVNLTRDPSQSPIAMLRIPAVECFIESSIAMHPLRELPSGTAYSAYQWPEHITLQNCLHTRLVQKTQIWGAKSGLDLTLL